MLNQKARDMGARWEIKFLTQTHYLRGCPEGETPPPHTTGCLPLAWVVRRSLHIMKHIQLLPQLNVEVCGVHWIESDVEHEKNATDHKTEERKSRSQRATTTARLCRLRSCWFVRKVQNSSVMLCRRLCKHLSEEMETKSMKQKGKQRGFSTTDRSDLTEFTLSDAGYGYQSL